MLFSWPRIITTAQFNVGNQTLRHCQYEKLPAPNLCRSRAHNGPVARSYDPLGYSLLLKPWVLQSSAPQLSWHQGRFHCRQAFHRPGGDGWFGDDSSALYLLCALFLLLLHQLHLRSSGIRSQRLGTPAKGLLNSPFTLPDLWLSCCPLDPLTPAPPSLGGPLLTAHLESWLPLLTPLRLQDKSPLL